jgi:exodeoxyribonuclease VII small subunit
VRRTTPRSRRSSSAWARYLGLEESLALFEEGIRLARGAQERLDAAEKRVEELIRIDENGDPVTRELEPE